MKHYWTDGVTSADGRRLSALPVIAPVWGNIDVA